jgi:arginyl-tRNA--protein-N-Asp/Glu arginylyltransferase
MKVPQIFWSMPHACSYLPGRSATMLFLDPHYDLDIHQYAGLVRLGFRRSGDLIYRPQCQACNACIPVRVPVEQFRGDRGQRRVWIRNQDLTVIPRPQVYEPEHFDLYRRYQVTRHAGGELNDPDPQKYAKFLCADGMNTAFYEFRHERKLLAVAVTDILPDGLSAVYTFFDPDEKRRSLGVFSVLWQIEEAKARSLPWVYLGYWIQECQKMSYKANYRPLELFTNGRWVLQDDPRAETQS